MKHEMDYMGKISWNMFVEARYLRDESDVIVLNILEKLIPPVFTGPKRRDTDFLMWLSRIWRKHHFSECYMHRLLFAFNLNHHQDFDECMQMHSDLNELSGMKCLCWKPPERVVHV